MTILLFFYFSSLERFSYLSRAFFCTLPLFSWFYSADRVLDIFIHTNIYIYKILFLNKISFLNFKFVTVYIIHKILVLFKNHLNYLKDNIFKCFLKKYNRLLLFFKKKTFSLHIKKTKTKKTYEDEKIFNDIKNLFRLKKWLNYTVIKDIRNPFRWGKETERIQDRILRNIKNLSEHEK